MVERLNFQSAKSSFMFLRFLFEYKRGASNILRSTPLLHKKILVSRRKFSFKAKLREETTHVHFNLLQS